MHRGGQLLAANHADHGRRHFHLDHLGTPRVVTDSGGAVKSRHDYWPCGEEVTSPTIEVMKFTGHERDVHGGAPPAPMGPQGPSCSQVELVDQVVSGSGTYIDCDDAHVGPGVTFTETAEVSVEAADDVIFDEFVIESGSEFSMVVESSSAGGGGGYHTRLVMERLGFLKAEIDKVVEANLRSDSIFGQRLLAENHATAILLSDEDANARGGHFAELMLNRAVRLAKQGKTNKALRALGRALHAAEDQVAHRGLGNLVKTVLSTARLKDHENRDLSVTLRPDGTVEIEDPALHAEILGKITEILQRYRAEVAEE